MTKHLNRLVFAGAIFLMAFALTACGGNGGGSGTTGTLELSMTDAPGDYQHVFVTIQEIKVHQAADDVAAADPGWTTIVNYGTGGVSGKVFDLTELENGNITSLGVAELEAGHYTQMRLILALDPVEPHLFANYVVIEKEGAEEGAVYTPGDLANSNFDVKELHLSSQLQTGIKIVKGFDIESQGATALMLDFDAKKSVFQAGNTDNWQLKPTIKVLETVTNSVSGTVTDADQAEVTYLDGASISAQLYDGAADLIDQVTFVGGATSGNPLPGDYFMYLPPNTYNIVAFMEGYATACQGVAATDYTNHDGIDFALTGLDTGPVTGNVTGPEGGTATLSFRQTINCGSGDVQVEVLSENIVFGGSYDVTLPVGDYQLVVSYGRTTQEFNPVSVSTGGITKDVSF